nr:MAG: capsid protein [Cressdnaviricota sp.]
MRPAGGVVARPGRHWLQNVANGGAAIAGYATRKYLSGTIKRSTRSAANSTERSASEPLTTQGDVRRAYSARRSRRVPRRVIKRARKFTRRVEKICDKELSPIKVLFYEASTVAAVSGNQGSIFDESLFLGTVLGSSAGQRDFGQIASGLGDSPTAQSNLRFSMSMLELSMISNAAGYAEVYTVKARKRHTLGSSSLYSFYTQGFTNEPAALTGGTTFTASTYGVSPFHNRLFCENFKILKKEVVFLPSGGPVNLTLKARMPRFWNIDKGYTSTSSPDFWADKWTIGYVVHFYGLPATGTGTAQAITVAYNVVRTYQLVNLRSAGTPASAQSMAA